MNLSSSNEEKSATNNEGKFSKDARQINDALIHIKANDSCVIIKMQTYTDPSHRQYNLHCKIKTVKQSPELLVFMSFHDTKLQRKTNRKAASLCQVSSLNLRKAFRLRRKMAVLCVIVPCRLV
jgi:hypothetical protein